MALCAWVSISTTSMLPPLDGDGGRQVVEQAGAVLGDDLDQGRGAAGLGVERHARRECAPCGWAASGLGRLRSSSFTSVLPAITRSAVARRRSTSVGFRSSVRERVGEGEGVQHQAAAVGEGLRLEDVHAEAGERSGHGGEQAGPVGGHQGQLPGRFQRGESPPPRRACGSSPRAPCARRFRLRVWVRR